MSANPETVAALVAILSPLKGTGEPYWIDDEARDRVGPDEPIRDAIAAALMLLEVDGMGGCPLCCS